MEPMSTRFWVGVDVSKEKFDAAVCYESSTHADMRQLPVKAFAHDAKGTAELLQWIATHKGCCAGVCAESTGIYSRLLSVQMGDCKRRPEDFPALSIINPLHVKGTARSLGLRDKSDTIDARVIAIHAAQRRPQPAPEREVHYEKLRALFHLRQSYGTRLTAVRNQIDTTLDKECRKLLEKDVKYLGKQIAEVEAMMAAYVEEVAELSRDRDLLTSIPGVGVVVATMVMSEFGDLRQWSRKQVVAYAGLYPRERTSGKSVRGKPRLAKGGGRLIRKVLYMPALQLLRREYGYNAGVLRLLREEKRPAMVCVGAGMRKMLTVMRAVLKSGQPFDPSKAL